MGSSDNTPNIDKQIYTIDNVICRHIAEANGDTRGIVSQDIFAQLRNFVEHIMLKIYANGNDIQDSYDNLCKGLTYGNSETICRCFFSSLLLYVMRFRRR